MNRRFRLFGFLAGIAAILGIVAYWWIEQRNGGWWVRLSEDRERAVRMRVLADIDQFLKNTFSYSLETSFNWARMHHFRWQEISVAGTIYERQSSKVLADVALTCFFRERKIDPTSIRLQVSWKKDAYDLMRGTKGVFKNNQAHPALAWVFELSSVTPVFLPMVGTEATIFKDNGQPTIVIRSLWPLTFGPHTPEYDRGSEDSFYYDWAVPAAIFLQREVFPDEGIVRYGPSYLNPPDTVHQGLDWLGLMRGSVSFPDGSCISFTMAKGGSYLNQSIRYEMYYKGDIRAKVSTEFRELTTRTEGGGSLGRNDNPYGISFRSSLNAEELMFEIPAIKPFPVIIPSSKQRKFGKWLSESSKS